MNENLLNNLYADVYSGNKKITDLSTEETNLIHETIKKLDSGEIRVVSKNDNTWVVNEWVKKTILLYFQISKNIAMGEAPSSFNGTNFNKTIWFDKVKNKFENWREENYQESKLRSVPMSYVRYGSYLAQRVILMPCFINVGAFVDEATMIDSMVTVGSCAQIGKNCHISSGVTIGGVLEPLQAKPVIIEDNCFIGAGSQVLEGVIVREGSVIASGATVSASTKIIDKETEQVYYGEIPANSVVVQGSVNTKNNISLNCLVIIKKVDSKTKSKTSINELLRF